MQFSPSSYYKTLPDEKAKDAGKRELWQLTLMLTHTDKESFEGALADWYIKWMDFLNERKVDEKGKRDIFIKGSEVLTEALEQTCNGCLYVMIILRWEYPIQPMP